MNRWSYSETHRPVRRKPTFDAGADRTTPAGSRCPDRSRRRPLRPLYLSWSPQRAALQLPKRTLFQAYADLAVKRRSAPICSGGRAGRENGWRRALQSAQSPCASTPNTQLAPASDSRSDRRPRRRLRHGRPSRTAGANDRHRRCWLMSQQLWLEAPPPKKIGPPM